MSAPLERSIGLWGAVWMGFGSIVGTGVFVSLGVAAGIAGPAVVIAVALAALVALADGLSRVGWGQYSLNFGFERAMNRPIYDDSVSRPRGVI